MDIEIYLQKVKDLFSSGKATEKQYEEMALAVLAMSEGDPDSVIEIDKKIDPSSLYGKGEEM